ncbi:MAG: N-6 DNA methylase [candidate division WS1 bacterium]|nr:N-6 DNA methylase [candidate division WS1 bacterium]
MSETPDPDLVSAPDDCRRQVAELVERFGRNRDQYRSAAYNEATLRTEFLDPFFEALGWDVANRAGYAEAYKDVVREVSVEVEGGRKAPDYCFRIGGQRKFFVEAKKPAINVKGDPGPAYQVRRYAWNAKLPLSLLTDFEELAVYDCSQKPALTDPPGTARLRFLTCDQYLEHLDEIYSLFSREAILKGAFDRFAEDHRKHRGTQEVDAAFLQEMERWREALAKDLARHNQLSVPELNFAVQALLDRILFLRIAEDRGVEHQDQLREVAGRRDCYSALCRRFEQADDKYNAGLFDFSPQGDTLCPGLTVSDRVLKAIITGLYYPSPYEFSVLGADILGAVYEQFLGKVIRLTPAGLAKVEEKPEVRKAGGVYYTPTYIVDYIVAHTVGEALAEAGTPEAVAKIHILDPACGSGSFLLGAYQCLLDWHLRYYLDHDPERQARKRRPPILRLSEHDWRLTIQERKRILLNNIFGVDIDRQAVEVTKLNLLLKCLEGVTRETADATLQLFHERLLPNLDENIKCGNSLIGSDYFADRLLPDEEELRRVNPFDWEQGFPEIMKAGGFDCVIGNPPYLSFSGRQKPEGYEGSIAYWKRHYPWDSWPTSHGLFLVRALELRRSGGTISFIVPDQVGHLAGYGPLREQIISRTGVREVRYWGEHVFGRVVTPALTLVVGDPVVAPTRIVDRNGAERMVQLGGAAPWVAYDNRGLLAKLAQVGRSLGDAVRDPGVHTGNCSAKLVTNEPIAECDCVPVLEGKQVSRYECASARKWLRLDYAPRRGEYFRIGHRDNYRQASFIIRQTAPYPIVGPRVGADYFRNSLLALYDFADHDTRYVVGLLNSTLLRFVYAQTTLEAGQKAFPQVKVASIRSLPIRTIDFDNPAEVKRHDRMVALVETMLDLHKRLPQAQTAQDRELLQRQIEATDREIDRLVYELYGLSEEEIALVEGEEG